MIDKEKGMPIYIQIQEILDKMLSDGILKSGENVPSEYEFAEKLGVSRLTVRKAYNEMVKRNIFYTVQGRGTFVREDYIVPTRERIIKSADDSKVIGVIFPEVTIFFTDILAAIKEKAAQYGYMINLMFNDNIDNESQAITTMISNNVDGVIIAPFRRSTTVIEHYQRLLNEGISVVMVGKPPSKIRCDSVYSDDIFASYKCVEQFIENEHKGIAFITNSKGDEEAMSERTEGYLRALSDYMPDSEPIIIDMADEKGDDELEKCISGVNPVTAFFCNGDNIAHQVYYAVKKIGKKVPEEVEIIGFDDNTILNDTLGVKLSSVNQLRSQMGYTTFDVLNNRIESNKAGIKNNFNNHVIIHPKIVWRDTTRR